MSERQTPTGERSARLQVEAELGRPASASDRSACDHRADDLALCPSCGRDLVYPIEWEPTQERAWSVTLRCPECEWRSSGVYSQDVVDRFDEVLDDGTQAVLDDLELLTRANMEEQVEVFVAALQAGLVLPEDF